MLTIDEFRSRFPKVEVLEHGLRIPGKTYSLYFVHGVKHIVNRYYNQDDIFIGLCEFSNSNRYFRNKLTSIQNCEISNVYWLCCDTRMLDCQYDLHIHQYIFIPTDVFNIQTVPILYDGIYIGHCESYKNADLLENVAEIRIQYKITKQWPIKLAKKIITNRFLSAREVAKLGNQSRFGVILSTEEGGCFVNGEYLACGLPVLSTKSIGGRDSFYTDNNVIYCEPTERSVRQQVDVILNQIRSGVFDRQLIREEFLVAVEEHKQRFRQLMHRLLDQIDYQASQRDLIESMMQLRNCGR